MVFEPKWEKPSRNKIDNQTNSQSFKIPQIRKPNPLQSDGDPLESCGNLLESEGDALESEGDPLESFRIKQHPLEP